MLYVADARHAPILLLAAPMYSKRMAVCSLESSGALAEAQFRDWDSRGQKLHIQVHADRSLRSDSLYGSHIVVWPQGTTSNTTGRKPYSLCVKCGFSDKQHDHGQALGTGNGGNSRPEMQEAAGQAPPFFWNPIRWLVHFADKQFAEKMFSGRAYFYPDDWVKHRSSERHWRHLVNSRNSRVIRALAPPVVTFGFISSVVAVYNYAVVDGWLPTYAPLLHAPSLPFELTAPALALLLVFRTEASYSRYDEARKTWTKVISSTKDLARQSQAWIQEPQLKAAFLRYCMAFPAALRCHLLYSADIQIEDSLRNLVDEEELAVIASSKHRPNCILQFMTQLLRRVHLNDTEMGHLHAHLVQFNEGISVCERIMRTPIPLSYTRLTSRFLVLWHLALPIVLWDDCQWLVIPATIFSAATLFCIEEVGVVIEEPFPILTLESIVTAAHKHVIELVELQTLVDNHLKERGLRSVSRPLNGSMKKPPADADSRLV